MIRRILFKLILLLFLFNNVAFAQLRLDTLGWTPPIDIPIYLAGNFAELRTGHFHAGLDIKTQGREGIKLYAVQDGYVSRIKVSPFGYGKAIYITHIDGYTSVYGHMKEYNIQIDKYVKAQQYSKKSFAVDLFPEPNTFVVKQGDVIGLSGNTGGSAGPHLHFEIRDSRTSEPMNGLFLEYDIKDDIAPEMTHLYVYPQTENSHVNNNNIKQSYVLDNKNGAYCLSNGDTLMAYGEIGLGLKVNDFLNGSRNRCGVHQIKMYVNNQLYYHSKFDKFSFLETRYINSLMDYQENKKKGIKLHKLFIEPNNNLSVYVNSKNRGVFNVASNKTYKVRIVAYDVKNNTSELKFTIIGSQAKQKSLYAKSYTHIIPWEHSFSLDTLGLHLEIPEKSFYDTARINFSVDTTHRSRIYAPIYKLHNKILPIHKRFEISIKHYPVPDYLKSKLLVVRYYGKSFVSCGGVLKDGVLTCKVRKLAPYTVALDTTPPKIKAVGIWEKTQSFSNLESLSFRITDNLSGIKTIRGYINGNWALFDWNPKKRMITYSFDEIMPDEGQVEVSLEVIDGRGNKSVYKKTCTRN